MTELFKTNVIHHYDAIRLKELLQKEFPRANFQFDLLHPDRRLRVEGDSVPVRRVIQIIKHEGFYCELIETRIKP
jgi:hypothetical protein